MFCGFTVFGDCCSLEMLQRFTKNCISVKMAWKKNMLISTWGFVRESTSKIHGRFVHRCMHWAHHIMIFLCDRLHSGKWQALFVKEIDENGKCFVDSKPCCSCFVCSSCAAIDVDKCFEINCEVRPGHLVNICMLIALMKVLGTGE